MMLGSTIGTTGAAGTAGGGGWQSAVRRPAMVSITGRSRSVSTDMYPAVTSPRGRAWLVSSFNAFADTSQLSAQVM